MLEVAIAIKNLIFNYGKLRVIDNISLEIPTGISFGLLGSNGAGKTTLIRLMVGLLKPAGGSILFLGHPPSPAIARNTGYMPQLPALYNELTVEENIDFFARIYGLRDGRVRSARIEEVLRLIELWQKRKTPVSQLSGGMKQRVSLGCAVVHQPRLLFLDEPTAGLDPDLRISFWEYFNSLTENGVTLIISSHTMDDAARCRRLAFLQEWKVIAQGSPAELKEGTGRADASLEDAFLYYIRRARVKENV